MARANNIVVCLVVFFGVLAATGLFQGAEAVDYTVGDSTGWQSPSSTNFYSNWADGKTFNVGDVLVFNFNTGSHDVATVTQAAYDACNIGNTQSIETTGPARITLSSSGEHYYLCTFSNHCNQGQKLAINVTGTSSSSPSPGSSPTTPSGSTSPPPPPSSAATLSSPLAAFSVLVMSIVIGLLF